MPISYFNYPLDTSSIYNPVLDTSLIIQHTIINRNINHNQLALANITALTADLDISRLSKYSFYYNFFQAMSKSDISRNRKSAATNQTTQNSPSRVSEETCVESPSTPASSSSGGSKLFSAPVIMAENKPILPPAASSDGGGYLEEAEQQLEEGENTGEDNESYNYGNGYDDDEPEEVLVRKVFIGGLSWDTTEESLYEFFSFYGEIETYQIMRDKVSKGSRGFGFVLFKSAADAAEVRMLANLVLDNRSIEIKPAISKASMNLPGFNRTKKLFIGGLHNDTTEADLEEFFGPYGRMKECVIQRTAGKRSRGFGFIMFCEEQSVDLVESFIQSGKPIIIKGAAVEAKRAVPKLPRWKHLLQKEQKDKVRKFQFLHLANPASVIDSLHDNGQQLPPSSSSSSKFNQQNLKNLVRDYNGRANTSLNWRNQQNELHNLYQQHHAQAAAALALQQQAMIMAEYLQQQQAINNINMNNALLGAVGPYCYDYTQMELLQQQQTASDMNFLSYNSNNNTNNHTDNNNNTNMAFPSPLTGSEFPLMLPAPYSIRLVEAMAPLQPCSSAAQGFPSQIALVDSSANGNSSLYVTPQRRNHRDSIATTASNLSGESSANISPTSTSVQTTGTPLSSASAQSSFATPQSSESNKSNSQASAASGEPKKFIRQLNFAMANNAAEKTAAAEDEAK
jgi:RNA recognition motif-containing protein